MEATPDDVKQSGRLRLGACIYDTAAGALCDAAGSPVPLRDQSLRVLDLLAQHAGQVVAKDMIAKQIWPGIAVTDDSLVQCIKDIRLAISDTERIIVQTVIGRGYRLCGTPERPVSPGSRPRLLVSRLRTSAASPYAREIAEEVAEQLVIDLSVRSGVVIMSDENRRDEAQYLIGGRVGEIGGNLRVFLEIRKTTTAQSIFAETWTASLSEAKKLPVSISQKVNSALRIHMIAFGGEEVAHRDDADLSVQELMTKAAYHMNRISLDHSQIARASLELAVERAPANPMALAMLASMATQMTPQIPFADIPDRTADVLEMADRAVALGPRIDIVLRTRGNLRLWLMKDHEGARLDCQRALEINPTFHLTHLTLATSEILAGQPREGLDRMHGMISLARTERQYPLFMSLVALAHLLLGNSAEAFDAARESHERLPSESWGALVYAVCAAGRDDLTKSDRFRAMLDAITLPFDHFRDMPFTNPRDVEMLEKRLRMVGFAGA